MNALVAQRSSGFTARFPVAVGNVLVVVNEFQDPVLMAAFLARIHRAEPVRIHLLAVEVPPTGHARAFLSKINVARILTENGLRALQPLRERLDAEGVPYRHEVAIGPWLETIAGHAQDSCCRRVLVGENKRSTLRNLVLAHDAWMLRSFLERAHFACDVLRGPRERAVPRPRLDQPTARRG